MSFAEISNYTRTSEEIIILLSSDDSLDSHQTWLLVLIICILLTSLFILITFVTFLIHKMKKNADTLNYEEERTKLNEIKEENDFIQYTV